MYANSTARLKLHNALVFDAVKLRQFTAECCGNLEMPLINPEAEGMVLIWNHVPAEAITQREVVTESRLCELGLIPRQPEEAQKEMRSPGSEDLLFEEAKSEVSDDSYQSAIDDSEY